MLYEPKLIEKLWSIETGTVNVGTFLKSICTVIVGTLKVPSAHLWPLVS